ncbi:hypothetical protein Sm713_23230 [Streptomyces sp. TS71-3]|nr:hypothetical protein Sm713_23230 [Streptomyces sp. TS71-3]
MARETIPCPNDACQGGRVSWTHTETHKEWNPSARKYINSYVVVTSEKNCHECQGDGYKTLHY